MGWREDFHALRARRNRAQTVELRQVEYAVDKTLSFGIAGSANNSNNYDEGIVQVYLRKTFDWFAPVAFKNDPVSIASRDHL